MKDMADHSTLKTMAPLTITSKNDKLILIMILLLIAISSWLKGGISRPYQTIIPYLATIILFIFLLSPYIRNTSHGNDLIMKKVQDIFRDPIFYLGTAFLCQLYIQYWNSGKVRLLEQAPSNVTFNSPYIEWLPGAVEHNLSWGMIVLFFPVFVALLIIRHGFSSPRMVRILFWGMIINASLLAILGFFVPLIVKNYSHWLVSFLPLQPRHFFSTFAYPNHAGSFFLSHLGLSCGLFFYYYNQKRESRSMPTIGILAGIMLLQFTAIHLTRCRYAILFSWFMAVSFISYLLFSFMKHHKVKQNKRVLITAGVLALLIFSSFVLYFSSPIEAREKLTALSNPVNFIQEQWNLKFWQIKAAVEIWLEQPVFGIGGGGYRQYLLQYVKNPEKRHFAKHYMGMAYVHNDFFQFLCEFGIIGTGLLIAIFIILVLQIARSKQLKQPIVFFSILGLGGILIHSLIDLPFRSPPVIITFTVVLAGLRMLNQNKQGKPIETQPEKKNSFSIFTLRYVNFSTLSVLFILIMLWWIFSPLRQGISKSIVKRVENEYSTHLINPPQDKITPWQSNASSPSALRSLWWAGVVYSDYKELHLLSSKINFDLYRNAKAVNKNKAKKYLKEAFRSSMLARRFTNYADIDFIKQHTAILDALGYYLEESWCLKRLGDFYPKDISVNLLLREYFFYRSYLYR